MTTFLHTADLHIDSPLKGLSAYPGAPVETIRGATRGALEALVELALRERVDVVVIAGDVYDGDWKDFSTGLYFRAQMGRLREAGIEVVLIHGNHDATSVVTRRLKLPGVHVLGADRPETVRFDSLGLAVHGQSFATRAVTENLAAGYPAPLKGYVNVGVLHTSLSGHLDHDTYAPATLEQLVAHGYDYWALGHLHDRDVLHEHPFVVFSGNLQGRHMRETGPKGATLVTVGEDGLSAVAHTLDVVRFERLALDIGGVVDDTELLERAETVLAGAVGTAEGRLLATRLELTGMTSAYAALIRDRDGLDAELRGLATDVGFEQVWLERIEWGISPPRSAAAVDESLGVALDVLRRAAEEETVLAELAEALRPLTVKLPAELKHGEDGLDPSDPAVIRRLLSEAQEMLPGYLLERAA